MNKPKRYEAMFMNENAIGAFSERTEKLTAEWFGMTVNGDVATLSIYGGLYSFDYDYLTAQLEGLANNDDVSSVVLHINSPGGAVAGLFDCCDYIRAFQKPITAYISGMACSAAYAIATSCDRVYSQQDAETGCCGCYAHALEVSDEAYKAAGFLSRVFRSRNAPRKNVSVITNEDEAKAYQAEVDALGDKYLAYVAGNRGVDVKTAEETFGQGAAVSAEYALSAGMIDGICSIEDICTPDVETTSSSQSESEGEDRDMDINAMSAEQQKDLFCQLCEANPSLLNERVEEAKRLEAERVSALNDLRNGSAEVDALVDAAVAEGKCCTDIALDVIKAMKEHPAPTHDETAKATLESLVETTDTVSIPVAKSEDQLIDEMVSRM